MQKVRSRLINFRVTDEEFERLKTASVVQGSRCLSEFARMVMLGTAADPLSPAETESLGSRLSVFDRRLTVLESNVARLLGTLVSAKPISKNSEAPHA